jgi:hypothetical protein
MSFMQILNLPSKIGLDIRDYTYGLWKAYFYGETLEEAKQYYDLVKPILEEHFDPGITCVIQRGCTEMNAQLPSRLWGDPVPPKELELERRLDDILEYQELNYDLAQWSISETKENWIGRAIQVGDPTAKAVAKEASRNPEIWQHLVVHSDHYHEVDPRGIPLKKEEITAEEMLVYFDAKMQEAGAVNKDMLKYMADLAGDGGDPMVELDAVMASLDPTAIDTFITDMQHWLGQQAEGEEETGEPPLKPPDNPEGKEGEQGGEVK